MPAPIPVQRRNLIITEYLLDGDYRRVAARNGITEACIRRWETKPWYEQVRSELQAQISTETKYNTAGLIRKTQQQLHDRLDNGDPIVLKGGLTVFAPVRALDLMRIGTAWHDRLRIMEGKPTKLNGNITLHAVMGQFQQLAGQYQNSPAVQEGEVIHSLSTTPTEGK